MSAHTHNHDAEALDWADRLAIEIALDMRTRGTRDACSLTAARLRLVKAQGKFDGFEDAGTILGGRS